MSVHLGAGTLIQNDSGEILLVKEGKEHVRGKWNLPSGGFSKEDEEVDETIREAAVRETYEETGLEVKLQGLIGLYTREADRTDMKNILVMFEASKVGGELDPNMDEEILDAKYFTVEEVRALELRFDLETIIDDFMREGSKNTPVRPLEY